MPGRPVTAIPRRRGPNRVGAFTPKYAPFTPAISRVPGFPVNSYNYTVHAGVYIASLPVSPVNVGDLAVLAVDVGLASTETGPSSITPSGGGVSTWNYIGRSSHTQGTDSNSWVDLWWGVVSAAGASTLTLSYGSQPTISGMEVTFDSFTAGMGAGTQWGVDVWAGNGQASTTVTFPSLTPTAQGAVEAYWGYSYVFGTGSVPAPTNNFTYTVLSGSTDVVAFDGRVITQPYAPAAHASGSTGNNDIAAVFYALPSVAAVLVDLGSLTSAGQSATTATVSAPQPIDLTSSGQSTTTATVATPQPISIASSGQSSDSLAFAAVITGMSTSGVSHGDTTVSAPQRISMISAGQSNATLTPAAYLGTLASAAVASDALTLAAVFTGLSSSGQASAVVTVSAPLAISMTTAGQSAATLALAAYLGALASIGQSSAAATVTRREPLALSVSAAQSAATAVVGASVPLPLDPVAAASAATLVPAVYLGTLTSAGQSSATLVPAAYLGALTSSATATPALSLNRTGVAGLAGLALWLKANDLTLNDGDAVGTWPDGSPSANDATQATVANKPTFKANQVNGLPAVSFDGVNSWLGSNADDSFANVGLTVFAVFSPHVINANGTLIGSATTTSGLQYRVAGSNAKMDALNQLTATIGTANNAVSADTWTSRSFDYGHSGAWHHYTQAGLLDGSGTSTQVFATGRTMRIGRTGSGAGEPYNGLIAELIVFDRVLNATDRQTVENYLQAKYFPVNLPLSTSAGQSSATASLTSGAAPVDLGTLTAAGQSSTVATVATPAALGAMSSSGQASDSLSMIVTPRLTLTAAGQATPALALNVPGPAFLTLTTAGQSATPALALAVTTYLSLTTPVGQATTSARLTFYLGALTAAGQASTAPLAVTTPDPQSLTLASVGQSATGAALKVRTILALNAAAGQSATQLAPIVRTTLHLSPVAGQATAALQPVGGYLGRLTSAGQSTGPRLGLNLPGAPKLALTAAGASDATLQVRRPQGFFLTRAVATSSATAALFTVQPPAIVLRARGASSAATVTLFVVQPPAVSLHARGASSATVALILPQPLPFGQSAGHATSRLVPATYLVLRAAGQASDRMNVTAWPVTPERDVIMTVGELVGIVAVMTQTGIVDVAETVGPVDVATEVDDLTVGELVEDLGVGAA